VAAGLQADQVQRVIVSTDDDEIAEVARAYGAEVPFRRPDALAEDHVRDFPVFEHALQWLEEHEGYRPDAVVQLRPTSPLRPVTAVDDAVATLARHPQADCVRSVTPSGQNPYKMWRIRDDRMTPLLQEEFDEPYNMPRQALPPTYWQTGHIDVMRRRTLLEKRSMTGDHLVPFVIDRGYALDIDTIEQWEMAEWALRNRDLDIVQPEAPPDPWQATRLLLLRFDGVLTDGVVSVDEHGQQAVFCDRGDGMGLELLRARDIPAVVLAEASDDAARRRSDKLKLPCQPFTGDRAEQVERLAREHAVPLSAVTYVGSDVDDLPALQTAGLGAVVADAHPRAIDAADRILSMPGGRGAVREVCDLILSQGILRPS
jgi:N-acylneuraminate cytidylyltransferase